MKDPEPEQAQLVFQPSQLLTCLPRTALWLLATICQAALLLNSHLGILPELALLLPLVPPGTCLLLYWNPSLRRCHGPVLLCLPPCEGPPQTLVQPWQSFLGKQCCLPAREVPCPGLGGLSA